MLLKPSSQHFFQAHIEIHFNVTCQAFNQRIIVGVSNQSTFVFWGGFFCFVFSFLSVVRERCFVSLQDCCPGDVIRVTDYSVRRIRINSQRWVFITAIWSGKKGQACRYNACWNVMSSLLCPPPPPPHSLLFSFSLQKWKKKDVCYLNFVPGCDSNFDKCTVTMDQSNSDQLHTQICAYGHTQTHAHTHTSMQAHPLYKHLCRHVYVHPPPLYQSAIGLSWFPVQQPDQWAWSCSPVVPQNVFSLPAQSHVGQQGQTTFKDNSVPPLCHPSFMSPPLYLHQHGEWTGVWACTSPLPSPPSPPDLFIHPSVCPPSQPILYPPTDRQTS